VSAAGLQLAAWLAAFWTAVVLHERHPRRTGSARFACALAAGAVLAHLGWALLHASPAGGLRPSPPALPLGYSVLFVPLGVLLVTRAPGALAALPLALAVARTGCVAAGCCGPAGVVPTRGVEVAGLLVLHRSLRALPDRSTGPALLAGFGLVRLATQPWRAAPALAEPPLAPEAVAGAWLVAGCTWGLARALRQRSSAKNSAAVVATSP
jgi:hypothetical protein